jgi:hypothetical protein
MLGWFQGLLSGKFKVGATAIEGAPDIVAQAVGGYGGTLVFDQSLQSSSSCAGRDA